jgi:hypothetical protein
MLQDIRVAWRFLRKAWISTALAVVTLGVTVAMCSVAVGLLDETFWRPLMFGNGERLVTIYDTRPSAPQFQVLSYPDYTTVRDRLHDGLELAAFFRVFQTLTGGDWPTRVQGEIVSGNYDQRELSIRAALGATPRDIVTSVAVEGVRLTALGLILGGIISFIGSGVLAGFLYGVAPRDPLVFALVPSAILMVSILAWFAPARRAATADPVTILKSE